MNKNDHSPKVIVSYVIGFIGSLVFTLSAFWLVNSKLNGSLSISTRSLSIAIFILAITQLMIQVIFFLKLKNESKPRWSTYAFVFTIFVVAVLVIGSIWIMNSLDYNMMPSSNNQYIIEDEGFGH